jgi:hypothetical protein
MQQQLKILAAGFLLVTALLPPTATARDLSNVSQNNEDDLGMELESSCYQIKDPIGYKFSITIKCDFDCPDWGHAVASMQAKAGLATKTSSGCFGWDDGPCQMPGTAALCITWVAKGEDDMCEGHSAGIITVAYLACYARGWSIIEPPTTNTFGPEAAREAALIGPGQICDGDLCTIIPSNGILAISTLESLVWFACKDDVCNRAGQTFEN